GSPGTPRAPGSLCISSRGLSSVMANGGSRLSGRTGDRLVDPDRRALTGAAEDLAGADEVVEREDAVDEGLRSGRAAGHVDVDGDDLVHALDDGVVVEHAALEAHTPIEMTHLG